MWNSNPSATSATPISSRKASASILVVGCSAMKAPTGLAARYITIIAMRTAAIITSICSAMPIAVMIESSEKTRSMSTSWAMIRENAARAGTARGSSLPSRPSTSRWISCVDLAIRNAPPPIRMMSRQEMAIPNRLNSGAVRPTSQVRPASIKTRNRKASDSPIWRTRRASLGSQREVRIEMKTRLSMPSTISSTDSVASANQAFGSSSSAIIGFQPIGQADGDDIDRNHDQAARHPGPGLEIGQNGDQREHRPGQHRHDVHTSQPDYPKRMHELERHEGQHHEHGHCRGREPGLRLEQK